MGSQGSWIAFIFGLLISTFLGGAVKIAISPSRTAEFVQRVARQKEPKFLFEFKDVRVSLKNGWLPQFAVQFSGLKIQAKDPCSNPYVLSADVLTVPIQVRSILDSKVRFGVVNANNVVASVRSDKCRDVLPSKEELNARILKTQSDLAKFFEKRWNREVANTAKIVSGVEVGEFKILNDSDRTIANFKNLDLSFEPAQFLGVAKFKMTPGYVLAGDGWDGEAEGVASVTSSGIHIHGDGNLKEGQIEYDIKWIPDSGRYQFFAVAKDFPAANSLAIGKHWGFLEQFNVNVRNYWFHCKIDGAGNASQGLTDLSMTDCYGYGDWGKIRFNEKKWRSDQDFGSIEIQAQDIDIASVLRSFRRDQNWGVVRQFGRFDGSVLVVNPEQVKLMGRIRNLQLFLASRTLRALQTVESANVAMEFRNSKYVTKVNDFVLREGNLNGFVDVVGQLGFESNFKIDFQSMKLPSQIQRIFLSGHVPDMKWKSEGKISKDRLIKLQGDIEIPFYDAHGYSLKNIRANHTLSESGWVLSARGQELELKPESKWLKIANEIVQSYSSETLVESFVGNRIDLEMGENGVLWKGLEMQEAKSKVWIQSTGAAAGSGKVNGSITSKQGQKKSKQWVFGGTLAEPHVELLVRQ
jgi:hypothetical protein